MEYLTETNEYRTPESQIGLIGRYYPSLAFHVRMIGIYRQGWWWACRGVYDGRRWVNGSLRVMRALESVGVRFNIENLGVMERVKDSVVFISNHMSTLETFVLPCLIHPKKKVTFIVKEDLLKFPFFGKVIRARNPIAVGRKDPRQDLRVVLQEGTKRLTSGTSVVVFPQTTRSEVFIPEKFNSIGAKLASRAQVPIIPIALKTDAWAVGKPLRDFGPIKPEKAVQIAFGEPVTAGGNSRELHEEVITFIQGKLMEWAKEAS
jgi:1-acyl-sn-glycerol-3-phosphate acyltransferase